MTGPSIPTGPGRAVSVLLVLCLVLPGGCSSSSRGSGSGPHRHGAKVNVADFLTNTAAYKGKTVTLVLKVEEPIDRSLGQSLHDYVGRDVAFSTSGPRGESLKLVIAIPDGMSVPDVGRSEEVTVTFFCTRGSLRQGNEARAVER